MSYKIDLFKRDVVSIKTTFLKVKSTRKKSFVKKILKSSFDVSIKFSVANSRFLVQSNFFVNRSLLKRFNYNFSKLINVVSKNLINSFKNIRIKTFIKNSFKNTSIYRISQRFIFKKNLIFARLNIRINIIYKCKVQKSIFINITLLNKFISRESVG